MKLTKVELLWSRECPLACAGCRMPNALRRAGRRVEHAGTLGQWRRGLQQLQSWGLQFVAVYGAEPLWRLDGLAQLVDTMYDLGIACTVITALPGHPRMRQLLAESRLDSLTVSYDALEAGDGAAGDAHRAAKSSQGLEVVQSSDLRDRAVVATVHHGNADAVPGMARHATDLGAWFMFDLLHCDIGPLGKCGRPGELRPPTVAQVRRMVDQLLALKASGARVHASEAYLRLLADSYSGQPRDLWHCYGQSTGWLTVDADGSLLPCDDWQRVYPGGLVWDDLDADHVAAWKDQAVQRCPGCAWNTHYDACAIERGELPVEGYVHD